VALKPLNILPGGRGHQGEGRAAVRHCGLGPCVWLWLDEVWVRRTEVIECVF
jgi:hypothetical protein